MHALGGLYILAFGTRIRPGQVQLLHCCSWYSVTEQGLFKTNQFHIIRRAKTIVS